MNGEVDTVDRAWDHFHDVSVVIRCPGDSKVGICAQLCIYAFRDVLIVVYDGEMSYGHGYRLWGGG